MKYKVLIRRCEDPRRLESVASAIAQWSGNTPDAVKAALAQKSVCIRQECEEEEANRLKQHFESAGAEVELVGLGASAAVASTGGGVVADNDDDDEDDSGRILSDSEYTQQLQSRPDIFVVEKDRKMTTIQLVCLILGILAGLFLSTREIVEVATDFFEKIPEERVAKIVKELPETLKKEEKKKEEEIKTEEKKIKPEKNKGAGGRTGGGGTYGHV